MCLDVVSKEWPYEQEEATFYKVLHIYSRNLNSPYYSYVWKAGENITQIIRPCKEDYFNLVKYIHFERPTEEVFDGLHCFLTMRSAEFCLGTLLRRGVYTNKYVVVKVTGKKEDFIALGSEDAVFTKLILSQEEYDRCVS